jgi:polyisoprenoid-binding protein YceI
MTDTATTATNLPSAGTWTIDVSHSNVGFKVKHLGLAKTRGRFAAFDGTVEIGENPTDTRIDVRIDAASVDTNDAKRDEHLRSADFFDVENHPHLTFRSTGVRGEGTEWVLDGELSVAGVTRPVSLEVEFDGLATDPWGGTRAGFTASTQVNREDFGLTWNAALEAGGFLVGKQVTIELDVELIKA